MKFAVLLVLSALPALAAPQPHFTESFDKAEPGTKLPAGFSVINGAFAVASEGTQRFLELPGAPLDTFGVLFGPATAPPVSATGRFFGTKTGRKFPAFGVGLGGAGGYRLQVSGAKKALEIFRADVSVATVPYEWQSGTWIRLRIALTENASGAATVRGKAWADGAAEPDKWTIHYADPVKPPEGPAAVWGNPFSGTSIRFDDLVVEGGP
jgi:hypothetical protein